MSTKLTPGELRCLDAVLNGQPLSSLGDGSARSASRLHRLFDDISRKFAWATACYDMPEHAFECDYSLQWFKVHPKEGRALVERYQTAAKAYEAAVAEADRAFWQARGGVAKPDEPADWASGLDD